MAHSTQHFGPIEESEREKASNSYLMSVVFIMFALSLPIINLIATFVFGLANRRSTTFVRWHCTQALLSQLSLFVINTGVFVWVVLLLFHVTTISNGFIGYVVTVFVFNIWEFVATVIAAVQTRKGFHHRWFFYGDLTDTLIKPRLWERSL